MASIEGPPSRTDMEGPIRYNTEFIYSSELSYRDISIEREEARIVSLKKSNGEE